MTEEEEQQISDALDRIERALQPPTAEEQKVIDEQVALDIEAMKKRWSRLDFIWW